MRILSGLLLSIFLLYPCVTVAAKSPCSAMRRDAAHTVSPGMAGYQLVRVRIVMSASSQEDARSGLYGFNLRSLSKKFRYDKDNVVIGIGACSADFVSKTGRFFTGGTTVFRVRGEVIREQAASFTLESPVLLPNDVVALKPLALTTLGISYVGIWGNDGDGSLLTFLPRE